MPEKRRAIARKSDQTALKRVRADALGENILAPFLRREQAMVAVIAAAFDGGGRNVIPCGLICDEFQRLLQRARHFFCGMLTPRQQVETGTAAERGTIDLTVDAFT